MSLPSLPLDVLLTILRDLDVVDIVRIGVACKDLYGVIQCHHIWVDQLEKLCRKHPTLRPATPPLTSLSTQELRTFVTGRVKLRLLWDKDDNRNGFVAKGWIGIPGINELHLLPGGKSVLVNGDRGDVTLHQIKLGDDQVSLPAVANLKYDQRAAAGPGGSNLLVAMSPCPMLIHKQENDIHLIKLDHHNGTISMETTFPIPKGYDFLYAHGQGRVLGFLFQGPHKPPRAVVIHLDHPGVSMEVEVPPTYTPETGLTPCLWGICIPAESLVIIYHIRHILAYEIPSFSTLSLGINLSSVTPMWYWPGPGQMEEYTQIMVLRVTSEALHDPRSAQEFNLHYICAGHPHHTNRFAITVTIPINLKGNFASRSAEPPAPKQKLTQAQRNGSYTARFFNREGFPLDAVIQGDEINILATLLDDLVLEDGKGTLRVSVPYEEFKERLRAAVVDVDEASGRIVIWGRKRHAYETQVFVGDLV